MLIQDIMQREVVTIAATASPVEAYGLMRQHGIRHLPVLEGRRLIGVVTDRDLRALTRELSAAPLDDEVLIADQMTPDPLTAGPLDPVEDAARIMHDRKIGCLPVLEGERLIGIVTVTDLLDALMRLTGVAQPGSRLAVTLPDEPGHLARLASLLSEQHVNIRSVLTYAEEERDHLRVIFRLSTLNPRPLAAHLREEGFAVIWPPDVREDA